jgi:predicted nuclease of predicted toxin-antitoxin system
MRVLLDENVPVELAPLLVDHLVDSVVGLGWTGVKNGELLRRAGAERFDVLVTMDASLEHQQNIAKLPFGVLLLRARSNRPEQLLPLVPAILSVIRRMTPGRIHQVGPNP